MNPAQPIPPAVTIGSTDPAIQQAADEMYLLSRQPAVAALFAMPKGQARIQQAMALAKQGYVIDGEIDAEGEDFYWRTSNRKAMGATWWPSILQPPISILPGLSPFPGVVAYDPANPPLGSIKVSLDPADYPAYVAPKLPTPAVAPVSPVGALIMYTANEFWSIPGDISPNGAETGVNGVPADARGSFTKTEIVTATPFGPSVTSFWTLTAPIARPAE